MKLIPSQRPAKKKASGKKSNRGGSRCKNPVKLMCREVLEEISEHEEAFYFLHPVDLQAIPSYKTIIKKPMDFETIKKRLNKNRLVF